MALYVQTEYKKYIQKNKIKYRTLILMYNLCDLFTYGIEELIFNKPNVGLKFQDAVIPQHYCWSLSRVAY